MDITYCEYTILQIIQSIKCKETSLEDWKNYLDAEVYENLKTVFTQDTAFTSWHM